VVARAQQAPEKGGSKHELLGAQAVIRRAPGVLVGEGQVLAATERFSQGGRNSKKTVA